MERQLKVGNSKSIEKRPEMKIYIFSISINTV